MVLTKKENDTPASENNNFANMNDQINDILDNAIDNIEQSRADVRQQLNLIDFVNISLGEFVKKTPNMSIFDNTSLKPPLSEDQLLLFFEHDGENIAVLSSPKHMIPYIENSTIQIFTKTSKNKVIENGFLFNMESNKDNLGITVFVPYMSGKKIYGFFKYIKRENLISPIRQYFNVGSCSEDEIVPSVSLPTVEPRPLESDITERDKVMAANCSPRFDKLSTTWKTVIDALDDYHYILHKTIDPNYIEKIMFANKQLSFPDEDIVNNDVSIV